MRPTTRTFRSRSVVALFGLTVLFVAFAPFTGQAQSRKEIVGSIAVSEEYNDNIYLLDGKNKRSDYITTISPGVMLINLGSVKNGLSLKYSPTCVRYRKYRASNTIRHAADLDLWHKFSRHVKFEVKDNYTRSEEPIEETEGWESQAVRHTRNTYDRNSLDSNLEWQFGPRNHLKLGYRHNLLENNDPSLDDTTEQGYCLGFSYWPGIRNGLELSYEFKRDRSNHVSSSVPDFDGYDVTIRYIHRFDPHTKVYMEYYWMIRDLRKHSFENNGVDDLGIGIEHDLSPYTSISLRGSYYKPSGYRANEAHKGYMANLNQRLENGNVRMTVESGWDEGYLEAERRELTRYRRASLNMTNQITRDLQAFVQLSCRRNEYQTSVTDKNYLAQGGLKFKLRPWLLLNFAYTYQRRESTSTSENEYENNSVMITLSASKRYQY